ncbi:Metalloenzyme, LuxS/M16 peptidase-like protein [Pisolithus orientalis]|uniref:Metalloenzyme, LuxS/M16 peptidase-like protein n=1 Tax=Pisolithus orientalis TaxID=936130 RepID=UPI00222474EA|nr:Metalloenzyme, LuxS/M16 peptidase-like protein [Pisolithus orientalis]KAI6012432.1 Metalloenzyme, LuxS/M16 peptidase-like protein [Pisolithus orientalis]
MRTVLRNGSGKRLQRHSSQATLPPLKITTLPNKIRVATESTPGHFASVGLYIDAGSRYEDSSTSGASHFLDRMAFKSTRTRSSEDMARVMDRLGGQIMASSARETIMYQSSHFDRATPLALSLISETVLQPTFAVEELHLQKDAAQYEIREINNKPEMILPEVLHEVAYGLRGLGNPLMCPGDRIDTITPDLLRQCITNWYTPERMVIAGAGMQHEQLVELADKYFSSLKPTTSPSPSTPRLSTASVAPPHLLPSSQPSVYKSLTRAASYLYPNSYTDVVNPVNPGSLYVGGVRHIPSVTQEFDHLYLAFEGVGIHDDDIYALATMQVLLGGGGSFSAGGPGKGMYSRLYTHILNHFPQVDHCASFHHIYSDSSLFGLFASFVPDIPMQKGNTPAQILPHLVHQLNLLIYQSVPAVELERAKNQLKSSLMMALESRAVEVEDLGRQARLLILVHDRKIPVTDMTAAIDKVTPETIRRVATRLFGPQSGNKASIVTMGRGDLGDWQATLRKYAVADV